MTETFTVTAEVEMELEIENAEDLDDETIEMVSKDTLGGFFSTYPSYLDGSNIEEKPSIQHIRVNQK